MMEKISQPKDYSEETALAQRVARIFGYDGLKIEVQEGAGWKTHRGENSITLIVDPTMLSPEATKDAVGNDLPDDIDIPAQYSIYGIAHELGHVDDFLQPENDLETLKKRTASEHFFWNLLDDGVINRRLRNIPLLNNLTDEVYRDMLFPSDDYTEHPKHTQFMYGWLFRNITPERKVDFSDDVVDALDSLEKVRVKLRRHNLYDILTHPGTDFARRREIAKEHIYPIYEAFLEEDIEEQQEDQESGDGQQSDSSSQDSQSDGSGGDSQGDQSSGQSDSTEQDQDADGQGGESGFDDMYDAYSDASHCGHEHDDDEEEPSADDHDTHPHEAIKEAAEILREMREEEAANSQSDGDGDGAEAYSTGAGSIAEELQLSPEDATVYQELIEKYRQQIHDVATILQLLTVPSTEYMSPRYRKTAAADGLKLSPRDLFRAVIASQTDEDPAIWRPVETIARREGLSFNGLDIHLVVDVSGSMHGEKAESAAACSVMLMEGLAQARRMVQRYNQQAPAPDVRLQTLVFGSSTRVISPLSHETEPHEKGIAFRTILDAASSSTLVADALQETVKSARSNPERTQLVYLISDGTFGDTAQAETMARSGGKNYFLAQYILQSPYSQQITEQYAHLENPEQLPIELNRQLQVLARKFLD